MRRLEWIEIGAHAVGLLICSTLAIFFLYRLISPLWSAKGRARNKSLDAHLRGRRNDISSDFVLASFVLFFAMVLSIFFMFAFTIVPM